MKGVWKGSMDPGRALVEMVASLLFYGHSLLCLSFCVWAVARAAGTGVTRSLTLVDWRDADGADEWIVEVSGYIILGLYLVFTEVYLYRLHLGG